MGEKKWLTVGANVYAEKRQQLESCVDKFPRDVDRGRKGAACLIKRPSRAGKGAAGKSGAVECVCSIAETMESSWSNWCKRSGKKTCLETVSLRHELPIVSVSLGSL